MICCYWTYRCFLNNLLWVLICLDVTAAREHLKAGSFYARVCEYIYCSHHAVWHLITGFFVLVWSVGRDLFFSLWNRHQKFVGCNVISPNCSPLCYCRGKCPIMRRDSLRCCPAKAIWIDSIMQNKLQREKKENQLSKAPLLPWEVRALADFVVNFRWQQICSLLFKPRSSHVCNFSCRIWNNPNKKNSLENQSFFPWLRAVFYWTDPRILQKGEPKAW